MKLTGEVKFRDLETGVWVLEGDDGKTYLLAGGDRQIKKPNSHCGHSTGRARKS